MAKNKYIVKLTDEERDRLKKLIHTGKSAAIKLTHARIILKADTSDPTRTLTDQEISEAVDVSIPTVERIRKRFVEEGLELALDRKKTPRDYKKILDGAKEAKLIALSCGPPPEGYARWSLRLLAEKLVELEIVEQISHETVRQNMKKK